MTHMVVHNSTVDPYSPSDGYYECRSCGERYESEADASAGCPDCDGEVRNIAVARE